MYGDGTNLECMYVMLFVLWVYALATVSTVCASEKEGLYTWGHRSGWRRHTRKCEEEKNVTLKTKKSNSCDRHFYFLYLFHTYCSLASNLNCLEIIIAECALSSVKKKVLRTTKFTGSHVFSKLAIGLQISRMSHRMCMNTFCNSWLTVKSEI